MKTLVTIFSLFALICCTSANTIIVDKNGGGQYTAIQNGINAASSGDTVKVWPETYNEQVTLSKSIVLMGSGCENTIITGNFDPTVTMTFGILQWFTISSSGGDGILLRGGTVKNCVLLGCSKSGIQFTGTGTGYVNNCVCYQNGTYGIWNSGSTGGNVYVVNCISRTNGSIGYYRVSYGLIYLSYSNGTTQNTTGNQGVVNCDPGFRSPPSDWHIAEDPSCSWNTGTPSLNDPDGSRSDMGYFGGPDCPIYPVVTEIIITPGVNSINLQAKARANY